MEDYILKRLPPPVGKKMTIKPALIILLLLITSSPNFALPATNTGTGFFISNNGYIVTNHHVISGAGKISIRDYRGNIHPAQVVSFDAANDLAVLKIEASGTSSLPIARSNIALKGERVFTLGFPNIETQGLESKLTDGIISSLTGFQGEPNRFQISVPIQPGSSGGPLINARGQAIGVIVAKLGATASTNASALIPENVSYAIKSNYLIELISNNRGITENLSKHGSEAKSNLSDLVEKIEPSVVLVLSEHPKDHPRSVSKDSASAHQYLYGEVIARVNGRPIPKVLFDIVLDGQIEQGKVNDATLHLAVREELIRREVLMLEANKQGFGQLPDTQSTRTRTDGSAYLIQSAALIQTFMRDRMKAFVVTEYEIKVEYESKKRESGGLQSQPPLEDIRPSITTKIRERKIGRYVDDLRASAVVE